MTNVELVQDEKKRIIVQHNDLIASRYNLDIDGFRVLVLLLSKVNQRAENPGWITITSYEFQTTFGVSSKNTSRCFKKAIDSLWNGSIEFHVMNKSIDSFIVLRWITGHAYVKIKGEPTRLKIKLNPDLDEFLFNIKSHFCSTFLSAIQKLKSVVGFRIYMHLLSHKNHPKCRRDGYFEVDISIENLRTLFPESSNRQDNLRKKTIEPAIKDINDSTDLSVNCYPIKHGRNVVGLRFGCVEEKGSITKPKRPRLAKRPHVTNGSHAEGEWMQKNAEILYQYEKALKEYDPVLRLEMSDLRRAVEYSRLFKPNWHREKKKELEQRAAK